MEENNSRTRKQPNPNTYNKPEPHMTNGDTNWNPHVHAKNHSPKVSVGNREEGLFV